MLIKSGTFNLVSRNQTLLIRRTNSYGIIHIFKRCKCTRNLYVKPHIFRAQSTKQSHDVDNELYIVNVPWKIEKVLNEVWRYSNAINGLQHTPHTTIAHAKHISNFICMRHH